MSQAAAMAAGGEYATCNAYIASRRGATRGIDVALASSWRCAVEILLDGFVLRTVLLAAEEYWPDLDPGNLNFLSKCALYAYDRCT